VSNFHDATPEGGHDESDFLDVAEQLSWFLHARVNWISVDEVFEAFTQLQQIEYGTHPALVRNAARTEDNTEELLARVDMILDDAVHFLLSGSGFAPRVTRLPESMVA
jgi:hypothetical protein